MIIGCFTPLVKIFLPYFWVPVLDKDGKPIIERDERGKPVLDRTGRPMPKEKKVTCSELLHTPDRIVQKEPMRFLVPRSVGAFGMALDRPTNCTDRNLVMYLTGDDIGQQIDETWQIHTETDCYGIASIPLRPDVQGALVSSIAGVEGETQAILREEQEAAKKAHDKAVLISHHRCVRAARHMVRNLKDQRQKDKEAGRGSYIPSPAEFLAAYFLAEQETKEAEGMKEVVSKFSGMMEAIEQKGNAAMGL